MNESTNAHADQNIRSNLFSGFNNLFPRKFHTVFEMQFLLRNINRVTVSDIFFHLIIEVQLFN